MSWQSDQLKALKKAGVPVSASQLLKDALIVETTNADGELLDIIVTKGSADAVADLLGYKKEVRYIVQAGYYSKKAYAQAQVQTLKDHGFTAALKKSGDGYIVQAGAYSVKANAALQLARLKAAGFDAFIREV